MKTMVRVAAMLVSGAVGSTLAADPPAANVQVAMLTKVNPQALALWDLTNAAQNDAGDIDPKKIDAATWSKLLEIGRSIEAGGRDLAAAHVVAAMPGAKLQDEAAPGASKASDVQRFIDAKPAFFRKHALELQSTGAGLVTAVTQRDGKKLTDLSNQLDEVCENCHMAFWYPQQSAAK